MEPGNLKFAAGLRPDQLVEEGRDLFGSGGCIEDALDGATRQRACGTQALRRTRAGIQLCCWKVAEHQRPVDRPAAPAGDQRGAGRPPHPIPGRRRT